MGSDVGAESTQEHPSTRTDVERLGPDRQPDHDRIRGAAVVARLAIGELQRENVDTARKLLAAALAMLDDAREDHEA